MKVGMDLNREKAIRMIVDDNSNIVLNLSIDCNTTKEDIEHYIESSEWTIDSFFSDCRDHQIRIEKQKIKLNKMMTHEIYELGEGMDLWKLIEKQKRL